MAPNVQVRASLQDYGDGCPYLPIGTRLLGLEKWLCWYALPMLIPRAAEARADLGLELLLECTKASGLCQGSKTITKLTSRSAKQTGKSVQNYLPPATIARTQLCYRTETQGIA